LHCRAEESRAKGRRKRVELKWTEKKSRRGHEINTIKARYDHRKVVSEKRRGEKRRLKQRREEERRGLEIKHNSSHIRLRRR
jgi:hypothetical protein